MKEKPSKQYPRNVSRLAPARREGHAQGKNSLVSGKLPLGVLWKFILRDARQHGGVGRGGQAGGDPHQWGVGVHGGARLSRNLDTKRKDAGVILAPPQKGRLEVSQSPASQKTASWRARRWDWPKGKPGRLLPCPPCYVVLGFQRPGFQVEMLCGV